MSEIERLAARNKAKGVVRSRYSWGPEAAGLDEEQRAGVINRLLDALEADEANTVTIPVSQLALIADALRAVADLARTDVKVWLTMPPAERKLRAEVSGLVDFPCLYAEQYLPDELQAERRKARVARMQQHGGVE